MYYCICNNSGKSTNEDTGMATRHNPTWETTVNNDARKFGHIIDFSAAAFALGYEYISWNDYIYFVWKDETGFLWEENTGLTREDLK